MKHKDVVINIKMMLEGVESPLTEECCIYRVPFDMRKVNEDAYTPKIISIGPFHHNTLPCLQNMERHKLIYCNAFLERTQTSLDKWVRYIEELVPLFRACYSDTIKFSDEELVKIIFVDSGFLFEFFWKEYHEEWSVNDSLFLKPLLADVISLDLLLLENQLPFFVLARLFNLSFAGNNDIPSFIELTVHYFNPYNRSKLSFNNISIKHFTDLLRIFHLQHPRQRRPRRTAELMTHLPSATELSEAGLSFKVHESDCLLDLTFSGGVLKMTELTVEDRTEVLFRNMLAFEQCHYPHQTYIADYVGVLYFLVNTSRDVDILVQNKVLVNWIGDTHSVANLFNSLGKHISQSNFNSHFIHLGHDLNDFHRNLCNNLKSTLRREYCKSPWQTAASIAAILLLIMSFIQTLCSGRKCTAYPTVKLNVVLSGATWLEPDPISRCFTDENLVT
ncbi:hypothetical protein VNO78_00933 [Psophocarpus tetragonolobus]|uniref:Uncharacterized protein n=1 Tax=Psophocarpus tetragonolobus TaxID=3891 RepID=A0AAN9SYY8_PSOTE